MGTKHRGEVNVVREPPARLLDKIYHVSSKTASTITATPPGSEQTPMVVRAPTPASGPKTSLNTSLQPSITAGSW